MNTTEWHARVVRILEQRNRYQFGQPDDSLVKEGEVACADTCIQLTVLLVKGKRVSLDKVRQRSGAPQDIPLTRDQALRALHSFGLPYVARSDLGAAGILQVARERGPVIICEKYWAHPQWKGYSYAGKTLNGLAKNGSGRTVRPGFARPAKKSGLTQWTFRDGHAVLAAADGWEGQEHVGFIRDPNHNSPARPERPAYDIVSMAQLDRMLESWPGRLVLAPTRRLFGNTPE